MDFFEAQDQARQRTGLLVFLFVLAVLVLVAMTNVLVMGALVLWDKNPAPLTQPLAAWFDWGLFASVSGGVVAVVALGTAAEIRDSRDPLVHQFINGLASGPITQRRLHTNYEEDLLGPAVVPEAMRVQGL